jgi:hypothetical protein
MKYSSDLEDKIELIQKNFAHLIGAKVVGYEIAQIWCDEEQEWDNWMDIPLFLIVGETTLSISWNEFDELGIEKGRVLPFSLGGTTVRWLSEGNELLDLIVGETIDTVSIGKGEMSIEDKEIEIWTRLLITLGNGMTFEVFNALDENGFALQENTILGEVKKCI